MIDRPRLEAVMAYLEGRADADPYLRDALALLQQTYHPALPADDEPVHVATPAFLRGYGERVQREMTRSGLNTADLARGSALAPDTVRRASRPLKLGPAIEVNRRLALALNVAPAWLAYGHLMKDTDR